MAHKVQNTGQPIQNGDTVKKTIILVVMLVSALALGCADAEKQDEEIELRVNATVAAWPTHTPYPTLTQEPTYTPYPTPEPLPTHTPYPTLTPEPTYTPLPTHTPYPTYTPMPMTTTPPVQNAPVVTNPQPGPMSEELLDQLVSMLWICTKNLPDFRDELVEGAMDAGLTEDDALAILENEKDFRAVVKELAEEEDWFGNHQEINAMIAVMELECGMEYPE